MDRVMIIGFSGSGKSTLAERLGKILGIAPVHLDSLFWLPGWRQNSRDKMREELMPTVESQRWIIDGNYSKILWEERFLRADTVIFLDINRFACFKNAFLRSRRFKGRTRPDMGKGCTEKFDLEFAKWILIDGPRKRKNHLCTVREAAAAGKEVHVFKSVKETNKWLKGLI